MDTKCIACHENEAESKGLCKRCLFIVGKCREMMKEAVPLNEDIYSDPRVQEIMAQMMPSLN